MGTTKDFTQLCVLAGVTLGDASPIEFIQYLNKTFDARFQYAEEVKTLPDMKGGIPVPDTGGRTDQFFYVHTDDVVRIAVARLKAGIRWWEDVLGNGGASIYPQAILDKYIPTWNEDTILGNNPGYKINGESAPESRELPTCELIGTDGNVFSIIGKVCQTLRRAGQSDKAKEFQAKALSSASYDEVLVLCMEYVDIE